LSSLGLGISSQDTDSAHTGRFIREGKAAARAVQRSLETGGSCSGEGWGFLWMLSLWVSVRVRWVLSLVMDVHELSLKSWSVFSLWGKTT
jgi:hypothetical protein